jgi:hypothetical protein
MTGLLLRLDDRDPIEWKALEPQILIEAPAAGESIADQIRVALIMRLPLVGVAQDAKMTSLSDHAEVVARVMLFLAAVVCLLVLWIGRAMDRSCSAIMPTRGEEGHPPSVWLRAARLNPQRFERGAALEGLKHDSARHAGGESTAALGIGTSDTQWLVARHDTL